MHKNLQLTQEDVHELRRLGITDTTKAKEMVMEVGKAKMAKKLYPELAKRGEMCQKALTNKVAFKLMLRIEEKNEREAAAAGHGSHAGVAHIAGGE